MSCSPTGNPDGPLNSGRVTAGVPSALHVYARAALLAALVVYGVKLAAMDVPSK